MIRFTNKVCYAAMIRALAAAATWFLLLFIIGVPLLLVGMVHPSRRLYAWATTLWARVILAVCGVRLTIKGAESIADGSARFLAGNHQSALDIPVLILALRGNVRFMAKRALFHVPIFGWLMLRYGNVPIDRSHARKVVRTLGGMLKRLERKPVSLVVFPEGTRTPDGRLLPFSRGAMKIGLRTRLPVVPFAIDGTLGVKRRGEFRLRAGPVRLTFGVPIPADEVAAMPVSELRDRVHKWIARQLGQVGE